MSDVDVNGFPADIFPPNWTRMVDDAVGGGEEPWIPDSPSDESPKEDTAKTFTESGVFSLDQQSLQVSQAREWPPSFVNDAVLDVTGETAEIRFLYVGAEGSIQPGTAVILPLSVAVLLSEQIVEAAELHDNELLRAVIQQVVDAVDADQPEAEQYAPADVVPGT